MRPLAKCISSRASVLTIVNLEGGRRRDSFICKNMWDEAIGTLVYNTQDTVKAYAATIKPVEDCAVST